MHKLVAIGGGTGLSVLLYGLKEYFNVTAVVTVGDNGGGSGKLREDLNMLPPGDVRNCLLALSDAPQDLKGLLNYRFINGELKGQSLGNLILAGMSEEYGSFRKGIAILSNILKLRGLVLPVSNSAMDLVAKLSNGEVVTGECEIAFEANRKGARIEDFYLKERVPLLPEVVDAVREAKAVILGPGSLYTSVIANLLVEPLPQLLKDKKLIYICNVMTQIEETNNFSVGDHVNELQKYLSRNIDYVLANDSIPSDDIILPYSKEGAKPVLITEEDRNLLKDKLIIGSFLEVKKGYIRSNALEIAKTIERLI